MTAPRFSGLPTRLAQSLRSGGKDAYGQTPERHTSDGIATPCRHCLRNIPAGEDYLIFAHMPFSAQQPYAETGPIFLCANECAAYDGEDVPETATLSPTYLIKGYMQDERIKYGTGAITGQQDIGKAVSDLLGRDEIAFVDIRSASNNCWIARAK